MSIKRSGFRLTIFNWRWWVILPAALVLVGVVLFHWILRNFAETIIWGVEQTEDLIKPFSSWMVRWTQGVDRARMKELKLLLDSANRNAQLAKLRNGDARYKNIMEHRVDVVLFNKKKYSWMDPLEFEV